MLSKPPSCNGCPLKDLSTGFMRPSLAGEGAYGVAIIGEALGEDEADQGKPFVGKAGFKLSRLIEWAGLDRGNFDIFNTVWCRPPGNKLEGQPYAAQATAHCRANHWDRLIAPNRVLVPMGNVPTQALTTNRAGILTIRGYIEGLNNQYIVPTVHPSFIARGQSKWSAAFINDLQKAVTLAREGYPPQLLNYCLDPSPADAYKWAQTYRARLVNEPSLYLAFDIETPGKGDDEDDLDNDSDAPDRTWTIERIGFSCGPLAALSVPWAPEYRAAICLLLASNGPKVVWNAGFDVPRVRRAGVTINGIIHDGMVAWHILHSDLPKRLGFVATFTCPWQPAWKHLSGARPAYYNATDADVELRSMIVIEAELRKTGLWEVYQKDVLDLEPILVHMHDKGMPIDQVIRLDRAIKLAEKFTDVKNQLEALVPLEARRIAHVYKVQPKICEGLLSRPGTRRIDLCAVCGLKKPPKNHFKKFVKKFNPCAGAHTVESEESVNEYYRLVEFSPSRNQLISYHQILKRPLPVVWDKQTRQRKVSFGERQIKDMIGKYPLDKIYPAVLQFREVQKLQGTYVGYPSGVGRPSECT